MFVSAIDAFPIEPFERSTTAATATVAQSWARRLIFVYDHPVAGPSFGTRISTSISSGPTAVWKTPVKNLDAGTVRSPVDPRTTSSPSSARITVGRSDAGSPCASEPPIVPR